MAGQNIPNLDDVSDVSPVAPAQSRDLSINPLPIRGEKRLVPTPMDPQGTTDSLRQQAAASGGSIATSIREADFNITAARKTFSDYVQVRIPKRGQDGASPVVFRFLVNPATVQVSKQTLDAQSMTRAGWQFGVWGDDVTEITMQGATAGQYFALGLTDLYEEFTLSYRNTIMLTSVFENNGYWFEGESAGEGPLAADFTRRRIKMHQDVELVVGNFIWYGMFTGFTLKQTADTPYLNTFSLTFAAWKERFRKSSPYRNSIESNVQRGHSPQAFQNYGNQQEQTQALQDFNKILPPSNPALPQKGWDTTSSPNAQDQAILNPDTQEPMPFSTDVSDYSPIGDILSPSQDTFGGLTKN